MIFKDNMNLYTGTLAERPTTRIQIGDKYYSTDTNDIFEWDGTNWSNINFNELLNIVNANNLINANGNYYYGNNYNNNFSNVYYNQTTHKLYFGANINVEQQKKYCLLELDLSSSLINPSMRYCDLTSLYSEMTLGSSGGMNIRGIVNIQGYLLIIIRSNVVVSMKPYTDEVYGVLFCVDTTTFSILWHENFGEYLTGLYSYYSQVDTRDYVVLNGRMGFSAFYYVMGGNSPSDISTGYSALALRDVQYTNGYRTHQVQSLPSTSSSTSGLSGNYKLIGNQSGYETGQIYHCNRSGSAGNWTYTWEKQDGLIDKYPYSDNYVQKMQENHHGAWYVREEPVVEVSSLPTASSTYEYTVNNRLVYKQGSNYYVCCHNLSNDTYEWARSYNKNTTILFISAGFADGVHVFDLTNFTKAPYADEYGHKTRIYNWYGPDHEEWKPFIYHDGTQDVQKSYHSFSAIVNYPYVYATLASDSNIVQQDITEHTNQRRMGVLTLDISDLTNITATMQHIPVDQMGYTGGTDTPPNVIYRTSKYLLLNNGQQGIAIFDISQNPATPKFVYNKTFNNLANVTDMCFLSENFAIIGEAISSDKGLSTLIYCGIND